MRHCFEVPDDDTMPGLWFCKCPAGVDLPPLIVVLCYGYSFTGPNRKIFGAFEDEDAAMAALRQEFYFDDDFWGEDRPDQKMTVPKKPGYIARNR